jgi:site-specific recombinase XerC
LHEGVALERVSKMLGHSKITQTQRYAKVLAEDVYGEFDKLGSRYDIATHEKAGNFNNNNIKTKGL